MFKMRRGLMAMLLVAVMLVATVGVNTAVFAAEATMYDVYTDSKYIVDSTDCTAESKDRYAFWDYDYAGRSAYENKGGEEHGFVDKVWSVSITKQKVIEPLAVGDGAVTLGFDAYVQDSNQASMSLAGALTAGVDYTSVEASSDNRRFFVNTENTKIGLGHSGGGTKDSLVNTSMTALWSQGTVPFGKDGEWVHYDMVIDMVYGNTLVFCDGELILKAAQPCQTLYALQFNSRNNGYGTNQVFYTDNYTLYRVPASALRNINDASEYKLAKNRIDYAIGVQGTSGAVGTENNFWTKLNGSSRYKKATDEFYAGEIAAGLPSVLYGYVEAAFTASYYPIKAFTDVYRNGEGTFTFSYDYFAGNNKNKELYLELYQEAAPTDYYSSARTRLINQSNGKFGFGANGTDLNNASATAMKTGAWHHMDVVLDMVNNKVTAYCDNVKYTEGNININQICGVAFEVKDRDVTNNQNNSAFYIDNFAFYWTPKQSFDVNNLSVLKDGVAIDGVSGLKAGDTLTVCANLSNTKEETVDCMVAFAIYNDGQISDVAVIPVSVESGKTADPSDSLKIESTDKLEVKAFVWDSKNLTPYVENIAY